MNRHIRLSVLALLIGASAMANAQATPDQVPRDQRVQSQVARPGSQAWFNTLDPMKDEQAPISNFDDRAQQLYPTPRAYRGHTVSSAPATAGDMLAHRRPGDPFYE